MKPYLLDTNVLIALAWPSHVFHRDAREWFTRNRVSGFRTCPVTEMGFLRISSNRAAIPDAVSVGEARAALERISRLTEYGFWPDILPFEEAVGRLVLTGHRQVTDAYLLALAAAHGGVLATFDRGVQALAKLSGHAVELLG